MTTTFQVQIIDGIGAHSGMQAYNKSLAGALEAGGLHPSIYSNYLDDRYGNSLGWILPNFYVGSIVGNVWRMLACGRQVFRFAKRVDGEQTWWLLHFHGATLGNLVLFLALSLASKRNRIGLIVHDVTSVHRRENAFVRAIKTLFYRHAPRLMIVHSAIAAEQLQAMGYRRALMHAVLFRMSDANVPPPQHIDDAALAAVLQSKRRRFLLFGSIRASKGLDTVLSALRQLPQQARDATLVVVAGRDSGGIIGLPGHEIPGDGSVALLDRFISNEERGALFASADLVLLPYRSIYQSGVLDVAVTHRVPVLASDLPTFRQFFADFPSFGRVYGSDASQLAEAILDELSKDAGGRPSYTEDDVARYTASDPALSFADDLRAAMKRLG